MTMVDLAALRADLLHLSWVKDARVSRQLPDTLVIDIVERKPHAVLRAGDHLVLIDETGAVLDPIAETVNMISASRSYQANVEVINTAKALMQKTLTIGQ